MIISARADSKRLVTLSVRKKHKLTSQGRKRDQDHSTCTVLPKVALTYMIMERSFPTATYSSSLKKKKLFTTAQKQKGGLKQNFHWFLLRDYSIKAIL